MEMGTAGFGMDRRGAPRTIKSRSARIRRVELPLRARTPLQYPTTRMGVEEVIRQSFLDARITRRVGTTRRRARSAARIRFRAARSVDGGDGGHPSKETSRALTCYVREILMLLNLGDELGFKIRELRTCSKGKSLEVDRGPRHRRRHVHRLVGLQGEGVRRVPVQPWR